MRLSQQTPTATYKTTMQSTLVKPNERYMGSNFTASFKVLTVYVPNEDNDTWVEYEQESTKQRYSCRMEAFYSRFTRIVD